MANTLQAVFFLIFTLGSTNALLSPFKLGHGWKNRNENSNSQKGTDDDTKFPTDFEIRNYSQTLDHFNYGPEEYATFQQRYAINFKYWGGASTNSPILLYPGNQDSLEDTSFHIGSLFVSASRMKSLLVLMEHRYYGESQPFGSQKEAYKNTTTFQYLSSEQALADCAQLITDIKKNLSAENCPVVVIGDFYAGMLAAWLRLKYPHIVIGALASSAPILFYDGIEPKNEFCDIIESDFRERSETCYNAIKNSWSEIDKIAAQQNGLNTLSQMFNICRPLIDVQDLKDNLLNVYDNYASFDDANNSHVDTICNAIDEEPHGTHPLRRIISAIRKLCRGRCFFLYSAKDLKIYEPSGHIWQLCTEFPAWLQYGCGKKDQMLPYQPFNLTQITISCKEINATPRPHWITIEYGGRNIKKVLEDFGSNIIFSNGLKDGYTSGGVLQNISDSIVALVTTNGSNSLDMYPPDASDPEWLVAQRNKENQIMENWIEEYNSKNI